jgi:hypothetical protein
MRIIGGRIQYFRFICESKCDLGAVTGVMVTVWLASASTAVGPTPSTGAVYRQPYSSPDGAIFPAVTMMVTCLPSQALAVVLHVPDPLAGASLSMTPPDLVPESGRRTDLRRFARPALPSWCGHRGGLRTQATDEKEARGR